MAIEDTKKLVEVNQVDIANALILAGWKLLAIGNREVEGEQWYCYSLGWQNEGEPNMKDLDARNFEWALY